MSCFSDHANFKQNKCTHLIYNPVPCVWQFRSPYSAAHKIIKKEFILVPTGLIYLRVKMHIFAVDICPLTLITAQWNNLNSFHRELSKRVILVCLFGRPLPENNIIPFD